MAEQANKVASLPSATQQHVSTDSQYAAVFQTLVNTDCSPFVKKTANGLSYLSWAHAIDLLLGVVPDAKFKLCEFSGEMVRNTVTGEFVLDEFGDPRVHNGEPFQRTALGVFVKAKVLVLGVVREMRLPVLDERNNVIETPSSFDLNTSGMRAVTKCVAMHGLGLSLYYGQDIPHGESKPRITVAPAVNMAAAMVAAVETPSPVAEATAAEPPAPDLKVEIERVRFAPTHKLRIFHAKAALVFKGTNLVSFQEAINARATELKVDLDAPPSDPEATGP